MNYNEKFPLLSSIAALLKILGVLVGVGGGVAIVVGIMKFEPGKFGVVYLAGGVLIIVIAAFIVMIAEWTGVLFAIEENGRSTAQYIESPRQTHADAGGSEQA